MRAWPVLLVLLLSSASAFAQSPLERPLRDRVLLEDVQVVSVVAPPQGSGRGSYEVQDGEGSRFPVISVDLPRLGERVDVEATVGQNPANALVRVLNETRRTRTDQTDEAWRVQLALVVTSLASVVLLGAGFVTGKD